MMGKIINYLYRFCLGEKIKGVLKMKNPPPPPKKNRLPDFKYTPPPPKNKFANFLIPPEELCLTAKELEEFLNN